MGVEIERKFLTKDYSFIDLASSKSEIIQGYLCREPERTVRIRIMDKEGFLTVKGKNHGMSRLEFEYRIPLDDAEKMLALCQGPVLTKSRYIVHYNDMKWEVDVFGGDKEGLVIAEIELESENTEIELPSFIGQEVTGQKKYYNSQL